MYSDIFKRLFYNNDIFLLPTADFQMGSSTALHPNVIRAGDKWIPIEDAGGWRYMHNHHYFLNDKQIRIWNHFNYCLDAARELRKNKKLVILLLGDLIDGDHHGTHELVTANIGEQKDTFIQLFKYIREKLDYRAGDAVFSVDGTFVHTGDEENSIAKEINAYQYADGTYSTAFLQMEINGSWIWAYHKGESAGQGQMRGNTCVNRLKKIYYQCLQEGDRIPDMIISAHTHDSYHATWTAPNGQTMHYIILPSWQDKTRFVRDNMATNKNKVGIQPIVLKENGEKIIYKALLSESPNGEVVNI